MTLFEYSSPIISDSLILLNMFLTFGINSKSLICSFDLCDFEHFLITERQKEQSYTQFI